jgi:uncharacterized protein
VASTSEDLFAAIDEGDVARVRALLTDEPALGRARDAQAVSAMLRARYRFDDDLVDAVRPYAGDLDVFEASAFGDVGRLRSLLADDPSLAMSVAGDGFTALHLAAFFDGPDVARALVDAGADVDAHGTGWMTGTALQSAASARNLPVAEVLVAAGADPDARQGQGWTPLHSAAHNGDVAMIAVLLAAGADVTLADDEGRTAADHARDDATRAALVG